MTVPRRAVILGAVAAVLLTGGVVAIAQHEPEGARVSVTLTLDRAAARVGDMVTATVQVRNSGDRATVVREACYSGSGDQLVVQQGLGPVPPSSVTGALQAWRNRMAEGLPASLHVDAATCDPAVRVRLEPGASWQRRIRWTATSVNGSAFDGTVSAVASVSHGYGFIRSAPVALSLSGGDPRRMSPMAAVDRALTHPAFRRAAQASGTLTGASSVAFDPVQSDHPAGTYVVHVRRALDTSSGTIHEAVVDARMGRVREVIESSYII